MSASMKLVNALIEYQSSHPINPLNVTDLFALLVGALEGDIEQRIKVERDPDLQRAYMLKLDALLKGWFAFQMATGQHSLEVCDLVTKKKG
jgi:FMN-dependent NADH-azoreductase